MSVQVRGYMCAKVRMAGGELMLQVLQILWRLGCRAGTSGRGGVYRDFIERRRGAGARHRKRPAVKRI